ncbi:MAG: helix-turn-helix domain-containing protein [Chitinophagaceae bacterium]
MGTVKNEITTTPILFPFEPDEFWEQLRLVIREEIVKTAKGKSTSTAYQTSGLDYKPLYKITEVCDLFQVTRPTIYDWVKHGKLRPHKIRSRVYFLWNDIQQLLADK